MLDAKCIRKTCRPSLRELKVPAVTALKLLTEFAHPETLLKGFQGCLEEDLAYGITHILYTRVELKMTQFRTNPTCLACHLHLPVNGAANLPIDSGLNANDPRVDERSVFIRGLSI